MKPKNSGSWTDIKASLTAMDRAGLIGLIKNLYEANGANRRFLHARFAPTGSRLEDYRDLVVEAVAPDPFSQRPVRLRDAIATITEYRRATGDLAGVLDLMLTFVEAGTEQAVDLGYGDEAYFGTLERKVDEAASLLLAVPDAARAEGVARLIALGEYRGKIGWGYGDFLWGVAVRLREGQQDAEVSTDGAV